MANSLSAKKRIRQSLKRRGRNRWRKDQVKDAVKAFEDAVHKGDSRQAADLLKAAYHELDRVSAKGTIHKKTAARKKSRLARRLARIGAAPADKK
ncbi:MAG: 30S ribosomal protein S20 [Planctomycetes bacterium]|nr:30S ribosomal protein S20 [Planctomycetota bacterium]